MANQIRNWVQSSVNVDYSMMKIMRGPTMEEMAEQVLEEVLGSGGGAEVGGEAKSELDKWVVRSKVVENPRLRLFCLPYFAGGASIFTSWHEFLPDDIEVCAIQMPGREERGDERPFDDVNELVAKITEVIEPLLTAPIAFYAHSSGAGIAFELARFLRREQGVNPTNFMVGGWRAPHLESPFEFLNAIGDDEVYAEKNIPNIKNHMRTLDIPDAVIDNDEVFNEMLPSLRADILLGKRYSYYEEEKFTCPIVAFAGSEDPVFDESQIKSWEDQAGGDFKFVMVNGGHLFCRDNKEELLETISVELSEVVEA
jgi:surfactin synthase thioesterase subunit